MSPAIDLCSPRYGLPLAVPMHVTVTMQGHACPILYAALCEIGLLTKEHLLTLRKVDSILEGHPTPVSLDQTSVFVPFNLFPHFFSAAPKLH